MSGEAQNNFAHSVIVECCKTHGSEKLEWQCQDKAGHFVFPEKGKRAKIFFGKGRLQFQNRAIKTKNKGVFSMKKYFGSQKIKEDWQ